MGAMHGWGRLTVALMSEFPAVLAGNAEVLTLVMAAAPVALMVWQLTMALKPGTGLVPCSAGGTGAWSARTRPRTCTRRSPSLLRAPFPAVMIHGSPPPGTVRIGLAAPTYGP